MFTRLTQVNYQRLFTNVLKCVHLNLARTGPTDESVALADPAKTWSRDTDLLGSLRDHLTGLLVQFWHSLG